MIDCDNLMEWKDLRKVVYRKKSAKWEKARRKGKQGGENVFIACASFL